MILDRERTGTTVQGTAPVLHDSEADAPFHEAGTSPLAPARRSSAQLWQVIRRSSRLRFAVHRIAADPLRGWLRPAGGQLYMEDDRITALNLVFDIRDARSHLDEDGDTLSLVDRFDVACRLPRSPIVRFHSTSVTPAAQDLLLSGELALSGSTVPVMLRGRLIPSGRGSHLVALSAAARVSLEDFGLPSPLRAGAEWLAMDRIEIVLDTRWSYSASESMSETSL